MGIFEVAEWGSVPFQRLVNWEVHIHYCQLFGDNSNTNDLDFTGRTWPRFEHWKLLNNIAVHELIPFKIGNWGSRWSRRLWKFKMTDGHCYLITDSLQTLKLSISEDSDYKILVETWKFNGADPKRQISIVFYYPIKL